MGRLSHDEFFSRLGELFSSRKAKAQGAVYLTQKRLPQSPDPSSPSASTSPTSALESPSTPRPILIRASNGKSKDRRSRSVKLSTVVDPDSLDVFYARYAEVCKSGMAALKPRDRSKKKAKARRKKGGAGTGANAA